MIFRSAGPQAGPTAIFDFDGTIADSLELAIAAYNRLAPRFGVKTVEPSELPRLRLLSGKEVLREHGVVFWKLPFLVRSMRLALREHMDTLQPLPNVAPALRALAAAGVRCCILSTNSSANIRRFLVNHDLHVFEHVAGGASMFGKARALRRLIRRANLDPRSTLYIGDEVRDLAAARAANIGSVAVTWGYAHRDALRARAPSYVVDTPDELLAIFRGLGHAG